MTDSTQPQPFGQSVPRPFDEPSALEELEQLADKIQLSRRQRAQAVAEFDAFVRTFREDRYAAARAASPREESRTENRPAVASAASHAARAVVPVTDADAPPAAASVLEAAPWDVAVPLEPIAVAAADRPARPRAAYVAVTLAALALVAVGVLLWRSAAAPVGPAATSNPAVVPAVSTAPAAPIASSPAGPAVPAPAASPQSAAGPRRALNIELITTRPVWTRVFVDGRRVIYRLLAADERIPLGADRAIAVRAGDAGALRLIVDGKDLGVLGGDGQVFQRVFTAQTR